MELLTGAQKKQIQRIGQSHDLCFVILHGSYAKGAPRPGSDLDIAVLGNRPLSFEKTLKIHEALAKTLGDNQKRELDVATLHGSDPLFRFEVTRRGTLLYGDAADYEDFKAYAYRSYMDSYDLRQLELKLLQKSVAGLAAAPAS